jgi:hypothetical protein
MIGSRRMERDHHEACVGEYRIAYMSFVKKKALER